MVKDQTPARHESGFANGEIRGCLSAPDAPLRSPRRDRARRRRFTVKTTRRPPLSVSHERIAGSPVLDTALTHAILRRVAGGDLGETLRLYVPDDAVLFSVLDARRPGFERARQQADRLGYQAVLRLAGGQAALFHTQCLAFSWAMPSPHPTLAIRPRFDLLSQWVKRSLNRLGVPSQVGLVPGEYCPGEYSVNASGRIKLMGIGQRVVRGAAHLGGVIVVRQSDRTRDILTPIYAALGLQWDPRTTGAVEDVVPGATLEEVRQALLAELQSIRTTEPTRLDTDTHSLAADLVSWHSPDANPQARMLPLNQKVIGVHEPPA